MLTTTSVIGKLNKAEYDSCASELHTCPWKLKPDRRYKVLLGAPLEEAVKDRTWHCFGLQELCMLAGSAVKTGVLRT